jgi:trypsin
VLVKVASISTHPSFSSETLDSDVAIWKLATDIPTNSSISYAKLPESESDPAAESVATVAGWYVPFSIIATND